MQALIREEDWRQHQAENARKDYFYIEKGKLKSCSKEKT